MASIDTETQSTAQSQDLPTSNAHANIRSRLLAMTYDGLIIIFLTTILVILIQALLIGGKEIPPDHILNKILKPFWFVPGFFYLAYYWTKSGQTPSMKIWKIRLVNQQGQLVSWPQALIRYISAVLGLGLLWAIFNKNRHSLQDIVSKTTLIKTID